MEENNLILTINVKCLGAHRVSSKSKTVQMIPFSASAKGDFFNGKTVCTGTDTQIITNDKKVFLSARYILAGKDFTGKKCHIYIENNTDKDGVLRPKITTDSAFLSKWEDESCIAKIEHTAHGVEVKIYTTRS